MYRRYGNSLAIKSGANFNTFNEITMTFKESNEQKAEVLPMKNIFKSNNTKETQTSEKKQANEEDSVTESENENHMENYKTVGNTTSSYKSDFFYVDSKFSTKMTFFPGVILNTVENQFGKSIKTTVQRHDIDHSSPDPSLQQMKCYKALDKHVTKVLSKIEKEGREPLFMLLAEVDLTSQSVRTKENNMANWISRLIQIESGADVVICHGGCLRSMRTFEKGHIFTIMDLYNLSPMPEHYEYAKVSGKLFVRILENGLRGLPDPLGCFAQLAGASVEVDISKNYNENEVRNRDSDLFAHRIKSVKLDHGEFDPDMELIVFGRHFIVEGKDGYVSFNDATHLGVEGKMVTNIQEMKDFFRMANKKKFQDEFKLFKSSLAPHISDSDLRVVQKKNHFYSIDHEKNQFVLDKNSQKIDSKKNETLTKKIFEKFQLNKGFSKEAFVNLLESLQISAIKRLRKYLIVEELRNVGGHTLFAINPKFYSKITWK